MAYESSNPGDAPFKKKLLNKELKDIEDELKEEGENVKAPFNDALPTLNRAGEPLIDLQRIHQLYDPNTVERLKALIDLVNRFLIYLTPLMKISELEPYKKEILGFRLPKKTYVRGGMQKFSEVFDLNMEYRIYEIIIELQQKTKKFWMPERSDEDGL